MREKPRCRSCQHKETDARQYPCNNCKEIQNTRVLRNAVDYYSEEKGACK